MPGKECDAIIDPQEKEDCRAYKGKYARKVNEGMNPLGRDMDRIGFDENTILNPKRGVNKGPSY